MKMFISFTSLFVSVIAVEYSKTQEGYFCWISGGLNKDLPNPTNILDVPRSYGPGGGRGGGIFAGPGSWKPAEIKPKSLEKLFISVMGPGNVLLATWSPYNYYHMKELTKNPYIDFKKKTFLYVGGYLDGTHLPVARALGQLYKELGYNVLLLDYLEFTARDFPVAVRLTRPVGKHVAEMLANLTTLGLDPKKLELAGLSLGGQTMSFIAKNYREITGKNISSLTALDPTGPCFRHISSEHRLDSSDADFVKVIATNIDGYGIASPVGHITYYVNGGEFQTGDVWWLPCDVLCSHIRSYFLWLSALINPGIFVAMQCDSVQQAREGNCYDRKPMVTNTMDLFADRNKPGIYYLHTFNRYPYGLGKQGLKRSGERTMKQLASLNYDDMLLVK